MQVLIGIRNSRRWARTFICIRFIEDLPFNHIKLARQLGFCYNYNLSLMPRQTRQSKSKPKHKSKEISKSRSSDSEPEAPLEHKRKRSSKQSRKKEEQPPMKEEKEGKEGKKEKKEKEGKGKKNEGKQEKNEKKEDEEVPAQVLPYELTLEAGVYTVKLHQTYTVKENHALYKQMESLFALFIQKEKRRNRKIHTHIPISYFPLFEFPLKDQKPSHDKCSICQFEYEQVENYEDPLVRETDEDIISLSCSHLLHKHCFYQLKGDKDWIRCPVCSSIFGEMIGDQSPGTMTSGVTPFMHCQGFDDVGTITISYNMSSGKRGAVQFQGTHRTAYLPDNEQGREVLGLLRKAFDRRLIFTVGRSVTTGRDNQVVWNGIHHKTNTEGGSAYFGYPDPTYFDRVKLELAAKGVV